MTMLKKIIYTLFLGSILQFLSVNESFFSLYAQQRDICIKDISIMDSCKNISDSIKLDSLIIKNKIIDSVLSQMTEELPKKSGISVFYVRLLITDIEEIKVAITGDMCTDYLFSDKQYGEIYGCLQLNGKYIFIIEYPSIKKIKEIDFFKKTDKIIFFKKQVISYDFKLENPEWIYLYKEGNLILEKSINTEYKIDALKKAYPLIPLEPLENTNMEKRKDTKCYTLPHRQRFSYGQSYNIEAVDWIKFPLFEWLPLDIRKNDTIFALKIFPNKDSVVYCDTNIYLCNKWWIQISSREYPIIIRRYKKVRSSLEYTLSEGTLFIADSEMKCKQMRVYNNDLKLCERYFRIGSIVYASGKIPYPKKKIKKRILNVSGKFLNQNHMF